jgi:putative membrane protein
MTKFTILTGIVLGFGAASAAQGQAPASASPDPSAASSPHQLAAAHSPKSNDSSNMEAPDPATFVKKAAQGGLTEVALSKAAAENSQDPKIRQFADQMVRDHSKANDELASIAKSKGLEVPTSLDSEHQAIVQKLSDKKGAQFDAAYSKQMKEDHAKTVALFQSATKSSDLDLAAFAKKTLPTLSEHKRMAGGLPGAAMHSAQSGAKAMKQ